ncbi:hypothetical protein SI65_02939 [Aspergillus cristatus]|uniref:Zn(2)-C6 fungal-type domain-containing protein n=1 Tax=Aspergillus cristatus TaxID=573508 RepID=A0A1E3BM96_ASPCR|nr:hypothetical protein SI65_02939 [Aspergillus cristatus]
MSQPIVPVNTTANKPPRKRNVITRGRTGCLTCRKRRLKCDENKPGCNNCRRIKAVCEGYNQKITFKDQTNLTVEKVKKAARKKAQASDTAKEDTSSDDTSAFSAEEVSSTAKVTQQQASFPPAQFVDCFVGLTSPETVLNDSFDSQDGLVFQDGLLATPPMSTLDDLLSSPAMISSNTGYMTPTSPASIDFLPSPTQVVSNATLSLAGAFEFPEDYTYFQYSTGGSFSSISKVLPLAELFQSEPMSSHVYDAAIALAALTLSNSKSQPANARSIRRHAFHHSLKAVQSMQNDLTQTGKLGTSASSNALRADAALSLFATTMLAANFELQRNSVLHWYSQMRGAALCLSATYTELMKKNTGMLLIRAFSRMALLLRLYNEGYSVTTPAFMPEHLSNWLNKLLRESSNLHDRILLFVEEVTALEIQKRQHPALETAWAVKSADLLHRLEQWRTDLPPSEIPVDDHTGAFLTMSSSTTANSSTLIRIPALYFPNSPDPCIAAVNYASYLCTRMRARTRYLHNPHNPPNFLDRILPPETEQTALTICRIAASNPPFHFADSFTYSYGMLPSVVGAYRWSSNHGLRAWAKNWLMGFRTIREGIWDVSRTLRLIKMMDEQGNSQGRGNGQAFVAIRAIDEPVDPSPEAEEGDGEGPFRVVLSTRGVEGARSNVIMVN